MMFKREEGFTLVELMVVVLIIGILVAIAVPVFLNASNNAEIKSCQANQRTIIGAMTTAYANDAISASQASFDVTPTASTPGAVLITGYIKAAPVCKRAVDGAPYKAQMDSGVPSVTADGSGGAGGFYTGHKLP